MKLPDGSVLPSSLKRKSPQTVNSLITNNVALKVGLVSDIIYSDDAQSISKRDIEYNVMVSEQAPQGGLTITTYRNCRVSNLFGMSNNNLTYTLQAQNNQDSLPENASIVLILCINGRSDGSNAIIVGGMTHPDSPAYTSDEGQFYDFNFNGINYNINKDGEYTITFDSPLDDDGKPTNPSASGTEIKIDKTGAVKISDNEGQFWSIDRANKISTWSNGNESIIIDKGNKAVSLTSSGTMDSSSQEAMTMSSQDAVSVSSQNDMSLKSNSNTTIEASANMNMKVGSAWSVNVSGNANLQIGGDLSMMAGGNASLQGTISSLGLGDVSIALVGVSQCIGVGNIGVPVISTILNGSLTCFCGT